MIKFSGDGEEVKLAGEFNNWTPENIDKQDEGGWSKTLRLAPGKYSYKFVVDGVWTVYSGSPTTTDEGGNVNNLLEVDEDSDASGDTDSWERVSIPDQHHPVETAQQDSAMTSSVNMQKISVIERLYSALSSVDEKMIVDNKAELVTTEEFSTTFYDTRDMFLQRKGIWLESTEDSQGTKTWTLSSIDKTDLKVFTTLEEVTEILQEVLKDSSSLVSMVTSSMQETMIKRVTVSRWSLSETAELELRSEDGEVTTALIRDVGDVVTGVKSIETWARRLKCVPFNNKISNSGA